jgi:hypothetical protein
MGLSGIVLITGKLASYFVIKRKKSRMSITKNSIVICNWNEGGEKIVKEIRSQQSDTDEYVSIFVISTSNINESQLKKRKEFKNVHFEINDPALHSVLEFEEVYKAKSIIILADNSNPDPDANSALIALAIRKVWEEKKSLTSTEDYLKPRIIAESINHRKMEHLKDAGVDEILCAQDFEYGIIAQCALNGKLSEVYHQLLEYSDDTVEFYVVPPENIPAKFYGKTFTEISQIILNNRISNPVIPVGIIRKNEKGDEHVILNPFEKRTSELQPYIGFFQPTDKLIILAYDFYKDTQDFFKTL